MLALSSGTRRRSRPVATLAQRHGSIFSLSSTKRWGCPPFLSLISTVVALSLMAVGLCLPSEVLAQQCSEIIISNPTPEPSPPQKPTQPPPSFEISPSPVILSATQVVSPTQVVSTSPVTCPSQVAQGPAGVRQAAALGTLSLLTATANSTNTNIGLRLASLRGETPGTSLSGLPRGFSLAKSDQHDTPLGTISSLGQPLERGGGASADSSSPPSRFGVFANGLGSFGDQDTTPREPGFIFIQRASPSAVTIDLPTAFP